MKLEGQRQVRVVAEKSGGFRVHVAWLPGSDECWEHLSHEALFEAGYDAHRLADRVKAKGEIDLAHWVWSPSKCTPIAAFQERPTARLEVVRRPASDAANRAALDTID